jgi:hypothetical protein
MAAVRQRVCDMLLMDNHYSLTVQYKSMGLVEDASSGHMMQEEFVAVVISEYPREIAL